MSATTQELRIDLDAADAAKAEEAAKKAAGETKDVKVDVADVKIEEQPAVKVEEPAKTDDEVIVKPEEGIAKLQKQLESERALRQDAERRAQEASESEVRARADSQENQLQLLTTAITQVKQANDLLKAKYRDARTAGDADAEFDIQTEMSTNAARLVQLEAGKAQLEKAPKPVARAQTDVVEEFANRCSPRAAAWVRSHPDFVRDARKNRKMIAAHELAMADGTIVADSDEYFSAIEQTLGLAKAAPASEPKNEEALSEASAPSRKPAPAAAPVSRTGNGTGSRANVVTLSPEEVEIASLNGQTPEEYARHKFALKKQGRLN